MQTIQKLKPLNNLPGPTNFAVLKDQYGMSACFMPGKFQVHHYQTHPDGIFLRFASLGWFGKNWYEIFPKWYGRIRKKESPTKQTQDSCCSLLSLLNPFPPPPPKKTRRWFQPNFRPKSQWGNLGNTVSNPDRLGGWLSALFGMVKTWPFRKVARDLQFGDQKVTLLESPGIQIKLCCFFTADVDLDCVTRQRYLSRCVWFQKSIQKCSAWNLCRVYWNQVQLGWRMKKFVNRFGWSSLLRREPHTKSGKRAQL